ncbi:MAG: TraR/DksA family transcriptional regulator [Saprospiraceae bacterium]|nr:TraR/DksA family transcriptional regulator [Saprospiraceae bacterium]
MNEPKVRYSDEDLQEFKVLIESKLAQAQEELNTTQQQIADLNENGFNQQGGDWYDDSTTHTDLEMLQRMMVRQQRYVQDLRNALLRIHNKTYGICSVTGVLIDKSRLRLVPHATKSIDGKNLANSGKEFSSDNTGDFFTTGTEDSERPSGKPIGDKVRLPGKRTTPPSGDDWEIDNETLEDTSYERRKFEDDEE